MVPDSTRRHAAATAGMVTRIPPSLRALLGAPLAGKLAGANALIAATAFVAVTIAMRPGHGGGADAGTVSLLLAGALLAALLADLGLVHLALRPLAELEAVANRVSRGDLKARVPASPLADPGMARVRGPSICCSTASPTIVCG